MIIVLGGKKGGTGKSNIAYLLAGAYQHQGVNVVLVDADENATCVNKAHRRNELFLQAEEDGDEALMQMTKSIPVQSIPSSQNARIPLQECKKNYDVVIVDTGGFESVAFKSVVMVADKIIIPTQLSQDDIEQLDPLFEWLRTQESDMRLRFDDYEMDIRAVFSRVNNYQASDKKEAREFLEEYADLISISAIAIKERSDVRKLSKSGLTYHDVKHKDRAQFELLIDELNGSREPLVARKV
ncbi:division plane positioning ATPase MipZ [Alteromonas sp.]|uniref:division plane positioning ATPase MipZ n=1 Tax=Alteromonas sp. TaxID=232 RepID=UPI00257E7173|nr:division plane positioning ATPase MipZ [Alteromonas sp.]